MTETATATSKAKTTKHAAPSSERLDYGIPKFAMPQFDLQKTELPEALREMAEKGVEQTRDAYAKARVASEEAVNLLENTYETASKRAADYNNKLIEITRTNMRAAFDYVQQLLDAKSPSELMELSTAQMRQQFEIVSAQSRELCVLAQEMATGAAGPIKISVSKALNKA
jgi:phasin